MTKMPIQPEVHLGEPEFKIEAYKDGWHKVVTVKGQETMEDTVYQLGYLLGKDNVRSSRLR